MISSRFEELERRCKKLKRKRVLKYTLLIFTLLFLVGMGYFFVVNGSKQQKKPDIKEVTLGKDIKADKKEEIDKNILMLRPDVDIESYSSTIPVVKKKKPITKTESKKEVQKKVETIKEDKKSFDINIENSDKLTILLKNYTIDKSYKNALALGSYFYNRQNYKKALIWAKKANSIDPSKADSWIIYAKSKYAQGQKKEAINSLETYLKIFNSSRAARVLSKFEEGE